ncbi:hypothetical protein I3843_09G045700 [Carya illinoinensis]|uniref:Uncharacterized protein n=1 Tax=Carya illinoinensis TaxID=32201 RepID=A0A8T1PH33_CARIL|nr:UPF0481 protein At3g47200-like [Carya illinoinensis]KAG6641034.1 hypothetical protein CIPAW_09G045300 [Carya illinoinensis]KAG6694375.1 hypothetical protein I3842_09G045300 [Carya illinoinensis]KAG7962032.1 hypothetical protein I3843_09G045700 [Carya illinoinensis]
MAGTREHVISMEELLSRKVHAVRTEADETSRGRDDICGLQGQGRIIELEDQEACELKKKRFENLSQTGDHSSLNTPNEGQKATPKIQKVPLLLRDHKHFDKYFTPRIVALGPIHHDEPKYQPAEEYKLRMTNCFVKESGKDAEFLFNVVEKNIKQLRHCFDEKVTKKYSDQDLAWMLFVDGCAILQSIHCAVGKCKDWKMKYDLLAFGTQDLFLLENQLPYQLLGDLMNSSAKKDQLTDSIQNFMITQASTTKTQTRMPLLWLRYFSLGKRKTHGPDAGEENKRYDKDKIKALLGEEEGTTERNRPNHLLDLLRTIIIGVKPKRSTAGDDKGRDDKIKQDRDGAAARSHSYRNVEELREAGIYVRCNSGDYSSIAIRFTKSLLLYPGFLWLSPIKVNGSMGPKFLNLIAYEMCPDFENNFEITSYILFLDSLIDNVKDVIQLRKKGILKNHLGSDEEVAQLFNEIGTDLVPDPNAYREVRNNIQTHFKTKWKTWIAEALHEHFRSPWTFLACRLQCLEN